MVKGKMNMALRLCDFCCHGYSNNHLVKFMKEPTVIVKRTDCRQENEMKPLSVPPQPPTSVDVLLFFS